MDANQNRVVSPTGVFAPMAAYSHGIIVPPGATLLFSSGQLGIAPDAHIPADIEAQCELCFTSLAAILRAADMSFDDVVRFSGFVTERDAFPIYGAVRSRFVQGRAFASTLIIVSGFTRPEFKVEVEITAAKVFAG